MNKYVLTKNGNVNVIPQLTYPNTLKVIGFEGPQIQGKATTAIMQCAENHFLFIKLGNSYR